MTKRPLKLYYLNAFLALLTMKEFPNLFVFIGGMANLLCLLSSYEVETKGGNLTSWVINYRLKQVFR